MVKQDVGDNYKTLTSYCKDNSIETIFLESRFKERIKQLADWGARLPYPSYDAHGKLILVYSPIKKHGRTKEFKKILDLELTGYESDKNKALVLLAINSY